MSKSLTIASLATAALGLAAAAAILLHSVYGGRPVADPASARCNAPAVRFEPTITHARYREAKVRFTCAGAVIAGTLTLPTGAGPHPAVVFVHGSGEAGRLTWRGAPLVRAFVGNGIAVLSYDKRGVGESQGSCCPGDQNHFNLLAADADGAVNAVRKRSEIDPAKVGFLGTSQAGWVVPLAVVRSQHHVAFIAMADSPAVTTGEEAQWSQLAGEDSSNPPALTRAKRDELTRKLHPNGFDPVPLLEQVAVPGVWVYGREDRSQPSEKGAANLERLRRYCYSLSARQRHAVTA